MRPAMMAARVDGVVSHRVRGNAEQKSVHITPSNRQKKHQPRQPNHPNHNQHHPPNASRSRHPSVRTSIASLSSIMGCAKRRLFRYISGRFMRESA